MTDPATAARSVRVCRRCKRKGHDWFPGGSAREFVPTTDICLRSRCDEQRVQLPYGDCLSGHPLADHYNADGTPRVVAGCAGPS